MILNYDNKIQILAKLESVEESVNWFQNNKHPDLIFLDIHLEDDLSFSIFEKVKVNSPIIFTTAFDEYAIKAFKLKSIDYLLKPIVQEELNQAINKYKDLTQTASPSIDLKDLYNMITQKNITYKERFSVAIGMKLKTFTINDIGYFYSAEGMTFMVLLNKTEYPVDYSLDALCNELNPKDFFRVNRQYLVKIQSIANVHVFPKSKIKIELNPVTKEDVFVSLDKVTAFKKWLDN
jgi:DNA-binding LytR/AlgR family response regulator